MPRLQNRLISLELLELLIILLDGTVSQLAIVGMIKCVKNSFKNEVLQG